MDSLLSTWLQLREPADAAARSDRLTRTIADALATGETVQVLDLATGTGSNLRYLAPHLPGRQRWLMVDRDSALLALLPDLMSSWGAGRRYEVATVSGNECVIEGEQLAVSYRNPVPGSEFLGRRGYLRGSSTGDRLCLARPGIGRVAGRARRALS